ncbi:MAG: UPF0175 family protein [archaeon]
MHVTTVRFEDKELVELKSLASELNFDQSTVLKQALRKGVRAMRLELALEKYAKNELTMGEAAKLSKLSIWQFMDELKRHNIQMQYSEEDLREDLETLKEFE